jgi:hypothetical protein
MRLNLAISLYKNTFFLYLFLLFLPFIF